MHSEAKKANMKNSLSRQILVVLFLLLSCGYGYSQLLFDSKKDDLIESFVEQTTGKGIRKIAVVDFKEGRSQQRLPLSNTLEDDLTIKIQNKSKFTLIERDKNEAALKELSRGLNSAYEGFDNPDKRKQFGRLVQADAIFTGTYREEGDNIVVNAKLINCETGVRIWSDTISVPRAEISAEDLQLPNYYQERPGISRDESGGNPAVKRTGTLSLNSKPSGANIYLDSEFVGKTPAVIQANPGRRNVTLLKDSYEDYFRNIEVQSDKTITHIAELNKKTGFLRLETNPSDAEIFIGGVRQKGLSPVSVTLPVGSYIVKVRKENYIDNEETVTIRYKTDLNKNIKLTEKPGSLLVTVDPAPADIRMDGDYIGTANPMYTRKEIPAGEHKITIVKDGYEDFTEYVTVHADKGETIRAVLRKTDVVKPQEQTYFSSSAPSALPSWLNFIAFDLDYILPAPAGFGDYIPNALGLDCELNFNYIRVGFLYWENKPQNLAGVDKVSGLSMELGANYYLMLSDRTALSIGGGGKLEGVRIYAKQSASSDPDATFGNNGGYLSAGLLGRFEKDLGWKVSYCVYFGSRFGAQVFKFGLFTYHF